MKRFADLYLHISFLSILAGCFSNCFTKLVAPRNFRISKRAAILNKLKSHFLIVIDVVFLNVRVDASQLKRWNHVEDEIVIDC
jgi:hypothetical protein